MKKYLSAAVASLILVTGVSVHAGEQQDKMKSCNAEAKTKDLKGDERKAFMKTCLSAKPASEASASSAKTTQQEKMKSCNADAKTKALKGDERKAFMKSCLSNHPAT
jgi:ribosomal protein S3AE